MHGDGDNVGFEVDMDVSSDPDDCFWSETCDVGGGGEPGYKSFVTRLTDPPDSVNLHALLARFPRTCRNLISSPINSPYESIWRSRSEQRRICFVEAATRKLSRTERMTLWKLKGFEVHIRRPDSILLKSRTSLSTMIRSATRMFG